MARQVGILDASRGGRSGRNRPAGEIPSTRIASWLASALLVACASSASPGPHATPASSPVAAAPSPPKVEKTPEARPAAPPTPTDPCHIDDELNLAHAAFAEKEPAATWRAAARSHLLSRENAERALSGIAQEIVSALASRRYEKLRNFSDEDGICLRAARGAACETLTPDELTACGHFGKRRAWAVDEGKDSPPEYTCGEAFRKIFYARDFLRAPEVRFNCFPEAGRSKNTAPIILSGPASGYVEFHDPGPADGTWRSLWLVFDGEPTAPVLVEMISDY